jgi:hypothetical protein
MIFIENIIHMATINSRNESQKYIKKVGDTFIHKPSDLNEDITLEILDVNTDLVFEVFQDEEGTNLLGNFSILFKQEDGVYLNLSGIQDVKVLGDVNYKNNLEVVEESEEKLLDWSDLNSSTVINTILKSL